MPPLNISLSGLATLAPSAVDLLRSGKRVTGLMGRSIARLAMQGLLRILALQGLGNHFGDPFVLLSYLKNLLVYAKDR